MRNGFGVHSLHLSILSNVFSCVAPYLCHLSVWLTFLAFCYSSLSFYFPDDCDSFLNDSSARVFVLDFTFCSLEEAI